MVYKEVEVTEGHRDGSILIPEPPKMPEDRIERVPGLTRFEIISGVIFMLSIVLFLLYKGFQKLF